MIQAFCLKRPRLSRSPFCCLATLLCFQSNIRALEVGQNIQGNIYSCSCLHLARMASVCLYLFLTLHKKSFACLLLKFLTFEILSSTVRRKKCSLCTHVCSNATLKSGDLLCMPQWAHTHLTHLLTSLPVWLLLCKTRCMQGILQKGKVSIIMHSKTAKNKSYAEHCLFLMWMFFKYRNTL